MKPKYHLSRFNTIYFCLVAVLWAAAYVAFSDLSANKLGELTGELLAMALLSCGFGWLAWRISGRGKRGGAITFNVVLTLLIIGRFNQVERRAEQKDAINAMSDISDDLRSDIKTAETKEDLQLAYAEFGHAREQQTQRLIEHTTGDRKKALQVAMDLAKTRDSMTVEWVLSYQNLMEAVLVMPEENVTEAVDRQKAMISEHTSLTGRLQQVMRGAKQQLIESLRPFGLNDPFVKGLVTGFAEEFDPGLPLLEQLFEGHKRLCDELTSVLDFLGRHSTSWSVVEGEMLFDAEALTAEYNALYGQLLATEAEIEEIGKQLLERK